MRKALASDKLLVVDILSKSFDKNKSINFVIKQDSKRKKRIEILMEYSFFMGMNFGNVFISDDNNSCAILLNNKKTSLKSFFWDIKLVLKVIGFQNIIKVLKREKKIKLKQPKESFVHLWYLGVSPKHQGKGIGTELLINIKKHYQKSNIYLETSTLSNIPFYKKNGFIIINQIDLGYKLFILKN